MLVATFFLQALSGVYAKDVHVRMACLNAVKCIPALAGHSIPENIEVATSIWLALLHDPEKVEYGSPTCTSVLGHTNMAPNSTIAQPCSPIGTVSKSKNAISSCAPAKSIAVLLRLQLFKRGYMPNLLHQYRF
nr:eIF-2-alpha kinase activator GCN1 isoform X17 [Ipomoea batatas]